MSSGFTSEQLMLASSARQCFARLPRYESCAAADDAGGTLHAMAEMFGELGIFGILAPEDAGGLGMGFTDAVMIAREAGRACLPFPLIEHVVAAFYLARIDAEAAAALIDGHALASAAGAGQLSATADKSGLRLRGTVFASYARHVRWLLVGGHQVDGAAFATVIDLKANPAVIEPGSSFDLTQSLDEVTLDHAVARSVPSDQQAVLALLAAAEILGIAEHLQERTIQHLRDRIQFGDPVGKFQAVKHIVADDHIWLENTRLAVTHAASVFDQLRADRLAGKQADHGGVERAVAVAKSCASRAARAFARDATQLHGAMGFSWELGLHLPVRRLVRLSTMFGSAYDHNDRLLTLVTPTNIPAPPPILAPSHRMPPRLSLAENTG